MKYMNIIFENERMLDNFQVFMYNKEITYFKQNDSKIWNQEDVSFRRRRKLYLKLFPGVGVRGRFCRGALFGHGRVGTTGA